MARIRPDRLPGTVVGTEAPALPGMDERAYPRTPVAGVHQLGLLLARTRRALPRVGCPVLVFRSATDHTATDDHSTLKSSSCTPSL